MNASTQQWNKEGLGSVVFKKGTLKLVFERPNKTYDAETMYIDVNAIKYQRPGDWYEGLTKLQAVLGDKSKMIELKKKAYKKMIEGLEAHFREQDALVLPNQPSYKRNPKRRKKGKIQKKGPQRGAGSYNALWHRLLYQVIFNKNPKVVGGAVLSFSLQDLMSVEVASRSPLRSIFMMEEFGTGLYADAEFRRPYAGSSTPWKVPQEIANAFGFPDAIFMWWPYYNFRQRAMLLFIAKKKKGSAIANRWIKEARDLHHPKMTLTNYKEKIGYRYIDFYKREFKRGKTRFGGVEGDERDRSNPLEYAYGNRGEGFGYKGREAKHLFYNREGLTAQIQLVQQGGYYWLLKYIDQEIQKTFPEFPSLANMVWPEPPVNI
jgi:hypothetical protein